MDIIRFMNKANAVGKYLILTVFALNLMTLVSAEDSTGPVGLTNALTEICTISQTFLGLAAMVLIVLAGTTYAIGQVLGAETRARASVWATAMLTGAIIGIVIYLVTPFIIVKLLEGTPAAATISADNPCGGAEGG